ncbi:MAG: hypothetical protein MJ228_00680 [Bacilli bacterium]|nr:hypothetical protein [Bacilli bacterium]
MRFGEYLKNKQPLVYRTFEHAIVNKRIAHAYLLCGEAGTPLLETAIFMAKTLVCDHPNPLACEECRSCGRIEHGSHLDFHVLGATESGIKKEEVENVVEDFSKTPAESKGIMIYVIHLVETMSVEAINSLLKFLEEPPAHTFAILTTQNEAKVLPTIISRCQCMRMLLSPRTEVIEEAVKEGVERKDAELISYFSNSVPLIVEESKSEEYLNAKESFLDALDALSRSKSEAVYMFERDIISKIDKKAKVRYFLDMLSIAFKDLVAINQNQEPLLTSYVTLIEPLKKWQHLEESLLEIMKTRNLLDLNINTTLLLEHLVNYITKEFIL